MTGAEAAAYLREWQRSYRLTDHEAAAWCRLSVSSFKRQKRGKSREPRQTVALAELYPIHNVEWIQVAEAALKAAKLGQKSPLVGRIS